MTPRARPRLMMPCRARRPPSRRSGGRTAPGTRRSPARAGAGPGAASGQFRGDLVLRAHVLRQRAMTFARRSRSRVDVPEQARAASTCRRRAGPVVVGDLAPGRQVAGALEFPDQQLGERVEGGRQQRRAQGERLAVPGMAPIRTLSYISAISMLRPRWSVPNGSGLNSDVVPDFASGQAAADLVQRPVPDPEHQPAGVLVGPARATRSPAGGADRRRAGRGGR